MNEKDSKIEDLRRRLYDKEDTISERHKDRVLHRVGHEVPYSWRDDYSKEELENMKRQNKIEKPKSSFSKKFFIGALVFFLFAVGFSVYKFYNGDSSVSSEKIDILVLGNAFAKGGEELQLQVEITNKNSAKLEFANLLIEYPKGASDENTDIVRLPRDVIGTIKSGESVIRNVNVTLYGEEKSTRNVKVSLEYHSEGSNAIITKTIEHPVTISSAPLSLTLTAPSDVTNEQDFSIKINTSLNTTLPEGNNIVQVYYPSNFVFENAVPSPTIGNSVWNLSELSLTKPFSIEIKGMMVGNEGDEQSFRVYAGATGRNNPAIVEMVYNSFLHKVSITKPFLETKILVNGEEKFEPSAYSNGNINVSLVWANNLPSRIIDAEIVATLSGNVFDKNNVNPYNGYFDSLNNKIIWSKNTISSLSDIEPGESGTVDFNIKPASLLIGNTSIKDPQINIEVSIKGKQPTTGTSFDEVNNFVKKSIKIISDFQIANSVKYLSGPLPPKAENETRYIVTWTLSNTSNFINNAQAKTELPEYVDFVGMASGTNDSVSYNNSTREIIWNAGSVRPNTGFDTSKEVSFIISFRPSISQVGSVPTIMKGIYLSGFDSFAEVEVNSEKQASTTFLQNDPNFQYGNEKVVK
ncbi:TPA: hypothetical protein DIC38_01655 [Candidatus Nomurabacteria bacterium]|nr:MAG: hypothetical protein O210_OD1C00001G0399 [Parcubacteria bacterium RAAC4_OD1_1]HCY26367.1 hypothetical protein [Candidatus Nomurabacteria bacterium]